MIGFLIECFFFSACTLQILVEVHYNGDPKVIRLKRNELQVIQLAKDLFELGYVTVKRDDNRACLHCTELTLIRMFC